ncbi:hypothetical protein ESCO_006284 [Escovopsis weberi]|uniref:MARVEL domain-containing protein n=1 Tax=Escovopsis weberi TaxID=150374 RepID=A0A0M8MWM5_ESCWE|nr:hypothetical protein ESCO_006284 [Escovopsis weberi]
MALARPVSLLIRSLELVAAVIIAGITGWYVRRLHPTFSSWSLSRLIYTLVLAALSILLSLLWLVPFSWALTHWPVDVVLSIAWFISFGLLIDWSDGSCYHPSRWRGVSPWLASCSRYKTTEAFVFLSALLWLASALVGRFWFG